MTLLNDHKEISLEMREVASHRNTHRFMSRLYMIPSFVLSVGIMLALTYVGRFLFSDYSEALVTTVICIAYGIAVSAAAFYILHERVSRMELHALTIHNEILKIRDQLADIQKCVCRKD